MRITVRRRILAVPLLISALLLTFQTPTASAARNGSQPTAASISGNALPRALSTAGLEDEPTQGLGSAAEPPSALEGVATPSQDSKGLSPTPVSQGSAPPVSLAMGSSQERTPIEQMQHCPAGQKPAAPEVYRGPEVWASVDGGTPYTPSQLGAWSNLPDMRKYSYWDPMGREPWGYALGMARLICGAANNSEVKIGMYFARALIIEETRPENDADAIWDALEWVVKHRGVKASMILEGQNSCVVAASGMSCSSPMSGSTSSNVYDVRQKVAERWKEIGTITYCINGCMNTKRFGTYFYGIEHEKFVSISNTIWPNSQPGTGPDASQHPLVISTSGNFARSQIRSYIQDAMFIYDDYKLFQQFDQRFDAMESCANNKCAIPRNPGTKYQALHLGLEGDRGVWASNIVRRPTDAGKGTEVIFSPQRTTDVNAYISQLDGIDCKVDRNVRVAMFNMTDSLAKTMANRLSALRKAGCNVEVLLSLPGGGRGLSADVVKTLNSAKVPYTCTARSMHTKLVLFGPDHGPGSILEGTQNMSVSGQLYSDEHIISIKSSQVSKPGYLADVAEVYGQYLAIFNDLKNLTGSDGKPASKSRCLA